jgi:hypothetical protein
MGTSAVQLENPLRHVVQEVPVMGYGEDRAGVALQMSFQPLHRFGVEVVGRLVQQQEIRLRNQQLAQRDSTPLTAGQHVHGRVGWRAT